jgi:hypothetical protein
LGCFINPPGIVIMLSLVFMIIGFKSDPNLLLQHERRVKMLLPIDGARGLGLAMGTVLLCPDGPGCYFFCGDFILVMQLLQFSIPSC